MFHPDAETLKTRLAIEVAHRMAGVFAHDICFVDLTGVTDEKSVDDAVAAALQLPTSTGRSSTTAIVDYLHDKTMLSVLDNCEHLVKACAPRPNALPGYRGADSTCDETHPASH